MISQEFIDQLLSRVDIVDVIDRYVPLKKGGQNYLACCPFHKEKSPSFTVSPSKQFYHCFGCGAHGTAISFVMEYQGLGFVDALKHLAEGIGLTLPEPDRRRDPVTEQAQRTQRLSLEALMQTAAGYYKQQLKASVPAVAYCRQRGLSGEVAARYGLGYAPDGWHNLAAVVQDYQEPTLVEAGLVIQGEDGRRYDRFRDRLMFPIRNQRGALIGFGGRVLGKGEPKYLNSPETPLFQKGQELYGLYEARQAIRQHNRVLVVEGYMDVVALAQFGVEYAVATLGTATTADHVHKLMRHADHITFCFDGDKAGQRAAWRALENSLPKLQDGKSLHFLFLPEEHDPDSYIRAMGQENFERMLNQNSLPLSAYLTRELSQRVDMSTPEGRADLIHQARPLLAQIAAPALALIIKKRLAELAGIEVDELDGLMGQKPVRKGRQAYRLPADTVRPAQMSLIRRQLKWLLMNPQWADDVKMPDSLTLSDEMACFAMLSERARDHEKVMTTAQLLESIRGTPWESLVGSVLQQAMLDPEEFAAPDENDRLQFRDGNERLLQLLRNAELDRLIQKSRGERLTPEESQLMRELLSFKGGM